MGLVSQTFNDSNFMHIYKPFAAFTLVLAISAHADDLTPLLIKACQEEKRALAAQSVATQSLSAFTGRLVTSSSR